MAGRSKHPGVDYRAVSWMDLGVLRKNLFRLPFKVGRLGLFGFSILGYLGIPGSAETCVTY